MFKCSKKVIAFCIFNVSVSLSLVFYLHRSAKENLNVMPGKMYHPRFKAKHDKTIREQMEKAFRLFHDIVQERTKICLLEPSVLYDLISDDEKDMLKDIGFNLNKYRGSNNVFSIGVFEKDIEVLRDAVVHTELESQGFRQWEIKAQVDTGTKLSNSHSVASSTHFLYLWDQIVLHVVVLFKRGNYIRHARLNVFPSEITKMQNSEKYLFTADDSIYSRFDLAFYPYQEGLNAVFVPTNIAVFLSQLETSRFIPCLANSFSLKNYSDPDRVSLEETVKLVIEELENLCQPDLRMFWLASSTLLGWYWNCGVTPHTSVLHFAIWADSINEDLITKFKKNPKVKDFNMLGKISESLELRLRVKSIEVDLFFTYRDLKKDAVYTVRHKSPALYNFKYYLPKFELCSGDFLDRRVSVPCNSENIIEAEYGKNWKNLNWDKKN